MAQRAHASGNDDDEGWATQRLRSMGADADDDDGANGPRGAALQERRLGDASSSEDEYGSSSGESSASDNAAAAATQVAGLPGRAKRARGSLHAAADTADADASPGGGPVIDCRGKGWRCGRHCP